MQLAPRTPGSPQDTPAPQRRLLKARSTYPTLSVVRLGRSPLRKLAWIFGFGR